MKWPLRIIRIKRNFSLIELIIVMTLISVIGATAALLAGNAIFKHMEYEQTRSVAVKVRFAISRIIKELRDNYSFSYCGDDPLTETVDTPYTTITFDPTENDTLTERIVYDPVAEDLLLYTQGGKASGEILLATVISGPDGVTFTRLASGVIKISVKTKFSSRKSTRNLTFEAFYYPR